MRSVFPEWQRGQGTAGRSNNASVPWPGSGGTIPNANNFARAASVNQSVVQAGVRTCRTRTFSTPASRTAFSIASGDLPHRWTAGIGWRDRHLDRSVVQPHVSQNTEIVDSQRRQFRIGDRSGCRPARSSKPVTMSHRDKSEADLHLRQQVAEVLGVPAGPAATLHPAILRLLQRCPVQHRRHCAQPDLTGFGQFAGEWPQRINRVLRAAMQFRGAVAKPDQPLGRVPHMIRGFLHVLSRQPRSAPDRRSRRAISGPTPRTPGTAGRS